MEKLTGAEVLLESLVKEEVKIIFGITGGAIMTVYHYLTKYPQIHHIHMRHEQGAVHAADGYARASGKVGVCLATSGPGATNLITGIANAYLDSVPLVAITGQVAAHLIGSNAFQEADVCGITSPITKRNYLVTKASEIASVVKEAFYLARTGRPGSVVIDIAKNAQLEKVKPDYSQKVRALSSNFRPEGSFSQIKKAAALINQSQKPIILAGHGVIISRAEGLLKKFAQKANLPVAVTLLGISSFPEDHPLFLGMVGMHGTIAANRASHEADLILAIGMRFDDRITGKLAGYAPKAKVIHLDIDPAEIGKNVPVDVPIVGDASKVLRKMISKVKTNQRKDWFGKIKKWRQSHRNLFSPQPTGKTGKISAAYVIKTLSEITGGLANIVADVGQNQMFTARFYQYNRKNNHFSAGGLGPMGYALPAAIGVKMARPRQLTWAIVGDGGFQMTNQELITLIQEKINLKILILNNGYLGLVRQWQELFYDKNYSGTKLLNPDFVKLAESSFIKAKRVKKPEQVKKTLRQACQYQGSCLIEFITEPEENIFPMIPTGAIINQMLLKK